MYFYLQDIEPGVECDILIRHPLFTITQDKKLNANDSETVNTHESSGN